MTRPLARVGLAVLSGLLFWAAYPPVDLWPLAFVSWVPLLLAVRETSPRAAALLGAAQGLVANLCGLRFLPAVIKTFGAIPYAACVALFVVLCIYNSGRVAFATWFAARARRNGWPELLTFTLAVAAGEALYP